MGATPHDAIALNEHTCMAATGAWSPGTTAVTSAARGVFADDPARRAEVMAAIE